MYQLHCLANTQSIFTADIVDIWFSILNLQLNIKFSFCLHKINDEAYVSSEWGRSEECYVCMAQSLYDVLTKKMILVNVWNFFQ